MAKKKENSTLFMSIGHLLAVACIVLVFVFGSLTYIVYSFNNFISSDMSFYDLLNEGNTWFKGGLVIVIALGVVGLLTVCALLLVLLLKKRSKNYCFVLAALLIVVAVLIFVGYEMYFAQFSEELGGGTAGTFISDAIKEYCSPGTGYYLMGITALVGAGIEILNGVLG